MKSLFLSLALAVVSFASVSDLNNAVVNALSPNDRTPAYACKQECAGSRYYATCMRDCLQRSRR